MYRLDYYNENVKNEQIHGFQTSKEAERYMQNHPEEDFGQYPLILSDSENEI